jgi:hypothetical protein
MKNASYYRALASLCRQQAAYNPDRCRELLGEAERWSIWRRPRFPTISKNAIQTQASVS